MYDMMLLISIGLVAYYKYKIFTLRLVRCSQGNACKSAQVVFALYSTYPRNREKIIVMDVKSRIQNAFLSTKNADSVFDQIVNDAESKCGAQSLSECYDEETLRNFQVSMMRYLWSMCSSQLQEAHLSSPKKTVFLLNALTLRRVVKAICLKIKERATPAVGVLREPPSLPNTTASPRGQLGGSIAIGYLAPKRRTVRIAKLQEDDASTLHVFWRRPEKRQVLEKKYAHEIGFDLPESHPLARTNQLTTTRIIHSNDNSCCDVQHELPWKYVTISSKARTFGSTDAYTLSIDGIQNIYRLCLHKVDIPMSVPLVATVKKFFYFSEDDDPMHIIDLASERMLERTVSRTQPLISALQDEMNDLGRHAYSIVQDKFTGRLAITQITATSTVSGRFSILFEQTRDNCAELLGFDRINYQGESRYEGSVPCANIFTARPNDAPAGTDLDEQREQAVGTVSVRIPQLCDQPILKLAATPGSDTRKTNEFTDYVLYENSHLGSPGLTLDSMSVAFSLDEVAEQCVVGEHELVFKCWYTSSAKPVNARETPVSDETGEENSFDKMNNCIGTMDNEISRALNQKNPKLDDQTVDPVVDKPFIIDEDEMEIDEEEENALTSMKMYQNNGLHNYTEKAPPVSTSTVREKLTPETAITFNTNSVVPRRKKLPPLTLPLN